MILSTVYVMCKNMKKSLDFYSSFFEEGPVQFNDDRWATFNSGVSLFSPSYDERLLNEGKRGCFNDAYIQQFLKEKTVRPGNSVVFNFYVDDLKKNMKD